MTALPAKLRLVAAREYILHADELIAELRSTCERQEAELAAARERIEELETRIEAMST